MRNSAEPEKEPAKRNQASFWDWSIMKESIKKMAAILTLSGLSLTGAASFAAEFEVLDRFSVDGYTVLRGSADVPGGFFTVGASTFVVKDGKVGVGTASPNGLLTLKSSGIGTAGGIRLIASDDANVAATISESPVTAGTGYIALTKNEVSQSAILLNGGGDSWFNTGGNVGIGTTSPAYPLVVQTNGTGTTVYSNIITRLQANAAGRDATLQFSDSITWAAFISMLNGDFNFRTGSGIDTLTLKNSGDVGIGTTGPNARFTVWTPAAAGIQPGIRVNNPVGFDAAGNGPSIIFSQDRSAAEDYQMANIFSGNSYTASSAGGYLGFGTRYGSANPVEQMRITSTGNVGIGTIGPNYKLSVNGPINSYDGVAGLGYLVLGDPADPSKYIGVWRGGDNTVTAGNSLNLQGINGINFMTTSGAGSTFSNGTVQMRIAPAGNVGIGTMGPANPLDVRTATSGNVEVLRVQALVSGAGATTEGSGIGFYRNQSNGQTHRAGYIAGYGASASAWGGDLAFFTHPANSTPDSTVTEWMRITSAGNVGIGTTNPGKTLDVNGSIGFTSLKPSGVSGSHVSYFSVNRATTGSVETRDIYKIDPSATPFSEGIIEITYGTRIQGVSDAVTGVVKKVFGYNKFNMGQVAVTSSAIIVEDATSAAHAPITAVVVGSGASAYIVLRVTFSASATSSSFVWGEVKILDMESGAIITKLI